MEYFPMVGICDFSKASTYIDKNEVHFVCHDIPGKNAHTDPIDAHTDPIFKTPGDFKIS